jgi:hypothetical protein
VISVSELSCRDPACPGLETVIAVFRHGEKPRTVRVLKPILAVTDDDLVEAIAPLLRH